GSHRRRRRGHGVLRRTGPAVIAGASAPFLLRLVTSPPALAGLRAALACPCLRWSWVGGLAVPFTVSRRSRRQGLRAPCALASWRPSATPDCLRCAVLATAPGNSARVTGDRHHERQIACFAGTPCLPGLRRGLRYGQPPSRQAPAPESGALHDDGLGPVRRTPEAVRRRFRRAGRMRP